ncbi:MAG TPA: bifunctional [glutamine synthetase] adenylyltransferase/[glutamine synthetase]-adenylyl-L-tyrosine phosphorylase [Nocardioidaceae bacterium]|nr:bifunctional [glutamine synthetase] adenylyltransferase/[glutamine synthetase]-adenylyl-L-tyrosine phosphorylase [Nocardioidaceae bacterium]
MTRTQTTAGRLARLGFEDAESALRDLDAVPGLSDDLLAALATAASPDRALRSLGRLVEHADDSAELLRQLSHDHALRTRLLAVLGLSTALGDHLARHPEQWHELAGPELGSCRPDAAALRAELVGVVADVEEEHAAVDALRVTYRRLLLQLVACDLTGELSMEEVGDELANLAAGTLEAALTIARSQLGERADTCRLAVIGMGKCGGRELNYVSDVDVIFVAEAAPGCDEDRALRNASLLAGHLIRICSEHTAEGTIWPVDAALRPEGKSAPLVRTLGSHRSYYQRWAKTWEFQALLKARPIAGDPGLGREYVEAIMPLVWEAADRDGFVSEVQAMRRRVLEHIPAREEDRQLKLGTGGLRDVEFAVQLLQLVHGRTDERLRSGTTLVALAALTGAGYVGREDGAALGDSYRFLRTLEHRIQLQQLRRTHVVPESGDDLRRLGRSMGLAKPAADALVREWKRHRREVHRLHEKLFYRPLLAAVAELPGDEVRLAPQAARARLTALGYVDPAGALRHIEALTAGVSRTAAIQRQLLPVMLGWFADAADPDAGLLAFRKVSDALGTAQWYLRRLRDDDLLAERMASVLASSGYATDLVLRAPETVALLASDAELTPRGREQVESDMLAAARRHDDPVKAIHSVRAIRRRELFRCAAADLLGLLDVEKVGESLSDLTAATLSGALATAVAAVEAERRTPLPTTMAIIAMGRLGGHELNYASDADVLFVHEPTPAAGERESQQAALEVAQEMRRLLALPAADPPLSVDADLRPEGKQGPLVRSLASYRAYYSRWSQTWEAQALLRAEPLCGNPDLQRRFAALIDPLRWPADGLSAREAAEVRRVKARIDAERLPRGADPATHTKLGRGGLADIEWTAQLLQMQHAGTVDGLRTTRTIRALQAAAAAELIETDDAETLSEAWRTVSRVRNAMMLVRTRRSDSLPREPKERARVAHVCGYGSDGAEALFDDYLRTTRRARQVIDRVFWE